MKNQKHKLLEYAQSNKIVIDEFIELEILNLIEKFNSTGIKLIFTNQPELSTNKNEALSSLL